MIPKIIHYCWFGGKPLPWSARKCIASWRKFFPGYEVKEWNEANFDVDMIPYTREAYARKKYAFVSDYARFWILYRYGGLYFDTDVEVIRPMEDIVAKGAFMGIEAHGKAGFTPDSSGVNPGLGLGVAPGLGLYKEILDHYASLHFVDKSGNQLPGTVVTHTTGVLLRRGLALQDRMQEVAGVWIYPNEYFNPLEDLTGRLTVTPHTRSIHRYAKTWVDHYGPVRLWLTRRLHRLLGVHTLSRLKRYFPF